MLHAELRLFTDGPGRPFFAAATTESAVSDRASPAAPQAAFTPVLGTNGDDVLNGGPGVQLMIGRRGDDTLDAGPGLDILIGGRDGDTYVFDVTGNTGDVIVDMGNAPTINGYYSSGLDVVELNGYASAETAMRGFDVSIEGDDLILHFANPSDPGVTGQVTVKNHFAGAEYALEVVRFGSSGAEPDYHVSFLTGDNYTYSVHSGPDQGGEDIVLGTHGTDELYGGIGNDFLFGGGGADHFMFHDEEEAGGGYDMILDFDTGFDVIDYTDIKTLGFEGVSVAANVYGNAVVSTAFGTIELIGVDAADVTEDVFAFF